MLNRQDEVPKPGPKMWIERLGADKEGVFTILAARIFGLNVHWDAQEARSLPCTVPAAKCFGCKKQLASRWKGYLHCFDHHHRRHCFLELTSHAASQLQEQLNGASNYRGNRIKVARGRGSKSRLKVTVVGVQHTGQELPLEISPEETLMDLWRMGGWQPDLGFEPPMVAA